MKFKSQGISIAWQKAEFSENEKNSDCYESRRAFKPQFAEAFVNYGIEAKEL
jgi:hypothetical protein